jgi:3-methylcrotonyl-CoA carboxylase alpha subunit
MRFLGSPRPIRSVLVANRGEIALRVMCTCARLGIRTIAVYSDADADALHVRRADEAVRIGPPSARESYLDMEALIAAAKRTGADAVHPGYGFLSENAAFVRRCEAAGLVFIGPSAEAVEKMGSKIESKQVAESVGVPTVPGYHGGSQDPAVLAREAKRVGFPLLIKASAGGGGRGMRRVDHADEFAAALAAGKAEAEAAFGDGSVLLEKLILNPRHLEVQVAGDRHGGLVHLFERDCSVQRNNQKVLEEAPAPNLPDSVREKLYDAALRLGRAIAYDSVGTVEFIMDQADDEPYFLEMNTRLQVEHPVTESITGVDLVEWQLMAAAGERLPLPQDMIHARGHAVEARLTAERADLGFQPATGEIALVAAPHGLRFDSGIEAGSRATPYYDSLLGKLIAHGVDRAAAVSRLASGLSEMSVLGIPTTQAFLRDAVRHRIFAAGEATTRFIEKAFPEGWRPEARELDRLRSAACALWVRPEGPEAAGDWVNPWLRRTALRVMPATRPGKISVHATDEYGEVDAEILVDRERITVEIDGHAESFRLSTGPKGTLELVSTESDRPFTAILRGDTVCVAHGGLALSSKIVARIDMPRIDQEIGGSGNAITAPLHGVVSQLHVALGDQVERGRPVLQMEAMKLIHTLKAPADGRIKSIMCAIGDTVPAGTILVEIAPEQLEEKS